MSRFSSIEDVWQYLEQIPMFSNAGSKAMSSGLESFQRFLNDIKNPETKFSSIHIAGTNGKGTTARMLEQVYEANGIKTGVFSSPHLLRYNERFRIHGNDCTDEEILQFFVLHEEILSHHTLSYFELSTAIAFWLFSTQQVDIAIIEAGLGGRLDSTNVIQPEIAVITNIGLDHQAILGDTKEQIAAEKAGIIKQNTPVVIGNVDSSAAEVILKKANLLNANAYQVSDEDLKRELTLKVHEDVNYWNAAVTLKIVELLSKTIPISKEQAVQVLVDFSGIPGRFEKLVDHKKWYFSGAHNKGAIQSLVQTVEGLGAKHKTLILALMKDKVDQELLTLLQDFDSIYFLQLHGERAATIDQIQKYLDVIELKEEGVQSILKELQSEVVIFAGSFYFYSTVRRWVSNN